MPFRVSAFVAVVAVLGLSSIAPVFAQPQAPVRPRYTAFQSIFRPGQMPQANPAAGFLGQNPPVGNPAGPQAPGFAYPPSAQPGTGPDVTPQPTGVVGTFNNLGHWYGGSAGLGHWYPNGPANGRGILGTAGMGVMGGGAGGSGPQGPGPRSAGASPLGSAFLGAAVVGQLRR